MRRVISVFVNSVYVLMIVVMAALLGALVGRGVMAFLSWLTT